MNTNGHEFIGKEVRSASQISRHGSVHSALAVVKRAPSLPYTQSVKKLVERR